MKQKNVKKHAPKKAGAVGRCAEADRLCRLGFRYQKEKRYAAAEKCLKKALAIECESGSPDSSRVLSALNDLVMLYGEAGKLEAAAEIAATLAEVSEERDGPDAENTVIYVNNLALAYDGLDRCAEADKLYARAQAGWANLYGDAFPEVGGILHRRAEMSRRQGDIAKAVELGRQALSVWVKTFDADHLEVAAELEFLAQVYGAAGQPGAAAPLAERARAIRVKEADPAQIAKRERENEGRVWKKEDGPNAQVSYFDCDGIPAYVKQRQFPVKVINGEEMTVYDLEKFFRESVSISRAEFERMGGTCPM